MTTTKAKLPKLSHERLSHAYILVTSRADRQALAGELAATILCQNGGDTACGSCRSCRKIAAGTHPDILPIYRPLDDKGKPKREVTVAQMREIGTTSVILPNEEKKKIYIIYDAEYMNRESQNALLKLLEEPPAHVCFVLCTENPSAFLETISSRCVSLFCDKVSQASYGEREHEYLGIIASENKLDLLRFCISLEELSSAELAEFLENTKALISDAIGSRVNALELSKARLTKTYRLVEKCTALLRSNVSVKQVLGLISVRTLDLE